MIYNYFIGRFNKTINVFDDYQNITYYLLDFFINVQIKPKLKWNKSYGVT